MDHTWTQIVTVSRFDLHALRSLKDMRCKVWLILCSHVSAFVNWNDSQVALKSCCSRGSHFMSLSFPPPPPDDGPASCLGLPLFRRQSVFRSSLEPQSQQRDCLSVMPSQLWLSPARRRPSPRNRLQGLSERLPPFPLPRTTHYQDRRKVPVKEPKR